jgi:hypothetical protein
MFGWLIGMDLEGSGPNVVEILSVDLFGETE